MEIYILFDIERVLVFISCKQTRLKFENLSRIMYIVRKYCYKPISILQLNYSTSDSRVHYRFYKKLSSWKITIVSYENVMHTHSVYVWKFLKRAKFKNQKKNIF